MAVRRMLILGVAFAVAALATAAFGQEARKYYMVDTVTVSDVNPDHHVLEAADVDGEAMRFVIDAGTEVREGGEVIAFSELQKGDRVAVNARAPAPDVESHPPIADLILVVREDADEVHEDADEEME